MEQIAPPTLVVGWSPDGALRILDQRRLPAEVVTRDLRTVDEVVDAIRTLAVRGAPAIGVAAAIGLAAGTAGHTRTEFEQAAARIRAARPTAVNLMWAVDRMLAVARAHHDDDAAGRAAAVRAEAERIRLEDVAMCRAIGEHGADLIGDGMRILTHCNAGRIATLDWGTATAPIYRAQQEGLPIHVWVSETRPRNQGAALTAWELGGRGVPHTLIADNAAGHLMQHGLVDVVIVGADRVTAAGDVANKIGTYLKALAAREHKIPFYVAFVGGSVDWSLRDGVREIPIEQRNAREVTHITGVNSAGRRVEVRLTPEGTPARNDGFDVTPAKLITGLITERGVCRASVAGLARLYGRSDRADRGLGRTARAPRR